MKEKLGCQFSLQKILYVFLKHLIPVTEGEKKSYSVYQRADPGGQCLLFYRTHSSLSKIYSCNRDRQINKNLTWLMCCSYETSAHYAGQPCSFLVLFLLYPNRVASFHYHLSFVLTESFLKQILFLIVLCFFCSSPIPTHDTLKPDTTLGLLSLQLLNTTHMHIINNRE